MNEWHRPRLYVVCMPRGTSMLLEIWGKLGLRLRLFHSCLPCFSVPAHESTASSMHHQVLTQALPSPFLTGGNRPGNFATICLFTEDLRVSQVWPTLQVAPQNLQTPSFWPLPAF